ncbi:MAG: phytanoyl-CoA dioxygenase family protein [Chitinophagaceae bacterium]
MNKTNEFIQNGFSIVENVYSSCEVEALLQQINRANTNKETFRKSAELFAIRQFLKEVPSTLDILLNDKLKTLLEQLFDGNHFIVKSIYFDKPQASNWFVSYHQDLTISVDKKIEQLGYESWTIKQNQFAVQPPLDILQNIVTVRIHLDDTNENNGALRVIPTSHRRGVCRPEAIDWNVEQQINCNVPQGGIMLMKPLLLHSSGRTTNNKQRRVIHIEFSNRELPDGLNWSERINCN